MTTLKALLFVTFSAILLAVSGKSLRNPRSHGFYRFFAWECVLAVILLNLDDWFHDPFSLPQILSWLFLTISLFLVIHGLHLLGTVGKPEKQREGDEPLIGLEKTTTLITTGVFRYIRHPLYSSLFFLCWGAFLKSLSWPAAVLTTAATLFLVVTARVEEKECVRFFGQPYEEYMKRTTMFIPFIF